MDEVRLALLGDKAAQRRQRQGRKRRRKSQVISVTISRTLLPAASIMPRHIVQTADRSVSMVGDGAT